MTDFGKYLSVQRIQCDIISHTDVSANGLAGAGAGRFPAYGRPVVRVENGILNFIFNSGTYYPKNPIMLRVKDADNYTWFTPGLLQSVDTDGAEFGEVMHLPDRIIYNDGIMHGIITGNSIGAHKEYLPPLKIITPPCPCGAGGVFNNLYSDGVKTILTYITSFPDDYYLWARVGAFVGGQFLSESEGFVGIFNNNANPVSNLPFSPSDFSLRRYNFDQHGYLIGVDRSVNQALDCFVSGYVYIKPASMNCDGTGDIPSINYELKWYSSVRAPWFSGTIAAGNYQSNAIGVSTIPNTFSTYNQYGAVDIFNSTECVELFGINTTYVIAAVYMNGLVYTLESNNTPLSLVISKPRTAVFLKSYANVKHTPNGLVNFHRPVSILGAYKT